MVPMIVEAIAVLALFTLAFGVVSGRIEKSPITAPMIFVAFGVLMSWWVTGFLDLEVDGDLVNVIGTTTLVFVLFTDAARIDLKLLRRYYRLPLRLLGIGLPLTIVFGTLAAVLLFERLNLWEAVALAIILAPTSPREPSGSSRPQESCSILIRMSTFS